MYPQLSSTLFIMGFITYILKCKQQPHLTFCPLNSLVWRKLFFHVEVNLLSFPLVCPKGITCWYAYSKLQLTDFNWTRSSRTKWYLFWLFWGLLQWHNFMGELPLLCLFQTSNFPDRLVHDPWFSGNFFWVDFAKEKLLMGDNPPFDA